MREAGLGQDKRLSHMDEKRQEVDAKPGSAAFCGAGGAFRERPVQWFSALAMVLIQSHLGSLKWRLPWSHPRPATQNLWGWGLGPLCFRSSPRWFCAAKGSHGSQPTVFRRLRSPAFLPGCQLVSYKRGIDPRSSDSPLVSLFSFEVLIPSFPENKT